MTDLAAREKPRPAAPARRVRSPRRRRQLLGLTGIAVVAALIAGTIMAFNQVFTPGVSATAIASQAGLLMTPGASVTLYGTDVGRVTSVTQDGDQARIGVSIDPGQTANIPADVRASIQAPTVFGPKYLGLVVPAHSAAQRLRSGQIIEPTAVPTEIDTVFAGLVSVLRSVNPAKLSATLGAISTALSGRGARLGDFIGQLDAYLREFNPSLPALSADLNTAPSVLKTYAGAMPDLIKTLGNLKVTSTTLVKQQAQFDAFLVNTTRFSGTATNFLSDNGGALERTLATLAPTSALLARYSPEFPCLFASAAEEGRLSTTHRIEMSAALVPGMKPYTYPDDLPAVKADDPPSCYGGPLSASQARKWGLVTFDDGSNGYFSGNGSLSPGTPPLAVRLFGPSAASAARKAASKGKGH